jgi:hypothetical protein
MIMKLNNTMASIEGEKLRPVTGVVIEEAICADRAGAERLSAQAANTSAPPS